MAVPPTSANGTSLPELGGELEELLVGGVQVPQRVQASSAAAASALPPASPPATGMPLSMWIAAARADPVVRAEQPAGPDRDVGLVQRGTRAVQVRPWARRDTDQASASLTVTSS